LRIDLIPAWSLVPLTQEISQDLIGFVKQKTKKQAETIIPGIGCEAN
jgi:hypothetical protein